MSGQPGMSTSGVSAGSQVESNHNEPLSASSTQGTTEATSPQPSPQPSTVVPVVTTSLGRRGLAPGLPKKQPAANSSAVPSLVRQSSTLSGDFVPAGDHPLMSPAAAGPYAPYSPVFTGALPPPGSFLPLKPPESWGDLFELAKIPEADLTRYVSLFAANDMPPPNGNVDSLRLFFDNQFLSSIGIELAGHRAKILVQVRQLLGGGSATVGGGGGVPVPRGAAPQRGGSRGVVPLGGAHGAAHHHGVAGMPSHSSPMANPNSPPLSRPPTKVKSGNEVINDQMRAPRDESARSLSPPAVKSIKSTHRMQIYRNDFRDPTHTDDDSDEEQQGYDAVSIGSSPRGDDSIQFKSNSRREGDGTLEDPLLDGGHVDQQPQQYPKPRQNTNQFSGRNDSIVTTGEYNSIKLDAMRYAQVTSDQLQCEDRVIVNTFKSNTNSSHRPFTWVDVSGRDRDRTHFKKALLDLTTTYGFSESLLLDMDLSVALPQVLTSQEDASQYVIILRVATERTDIEEDSLHELTNRWMVAVNLENHTIATIHRMDSFPLAKMRLGWQEYEVDLLSYHGLICKIFDDSIVAYIDALQESEFLLDKYEGVMLKHSVGGGGDEKGDAAIAAAVGKVSGASKKRKTTSSSKNNSKGWRSKLPSFLGRESGAGRDKILEDLEATANFGSLTTRSKANVLPLLLLDRQNQLTKQRMNQLLYHLHRRCSVYSRMLSLTQAALESAYSSIQICSAEYAEQMSRSCGELALKAEGLHDNCQNLLNLHLSLVSFRTNELMNILTIFSAFFIPLTFISGVYGMNFVNMPELDLVYGYYYCLTAMALITICVWVFFRSKGLI